MSHAPRYPSWRESLFDNAAWKAVSVALAVLTWLTLRSGLQSGLPANELRIFRAVPITVMTEAADDRVFRVEPAVVAVTVSGPAGLVGALHAAEIEPYVNLTGIREATVLRKRLQVYAPSGVSVVRLQPTEVRVQAQVLPRAPAQSEPKPNS